MAEMTWHQAIQHVLNENGGPMHAQDITDRIIELELRENPGATPRNTVNVYLTSSVSNEGNDSPYVRVERAVYGLRNQDVPGYSVCSAGKTADDVQLVDAELADADDVGLVQAFGMFWRRDAVHWSASVAVLGRQQIGAKEVNFAGQLGVYLLHDGREVVYVGRSTDRPMGRRLFEHTKDRLQTRWDRFSWFGLLKVTEDGELVEAQASLTPELVAVTLEAVLIEGLEPRQNRRRGDGFNATEYLQAEDPEIERRQHLHFIDSLKAKF